MEKGEAVAGGFQAQPAALVVHFERLGLAARACVRCGRAHLLSVMEPSSQTKDAPGLAGNTRVGEDTKVAKLVAN